MLNVIMLNVIMLNVIMLNVIMLNVIMLSIIMLDVVVPGEWVISLIKKTNEWYSQNVSQRFSKQFKR
jgi:hypothetical protein